MKRILFVMLVTILACNDQSPRPTVAGHWSGHTTNGHAFILDLTQSGTDVSGTGSIIAPLGARTLTVKGFYGGDQSGLGLTMTSTNTNETFTFNAVVTGNSLAGELNGGPYTRDVVTANRQ